MNLIDELNNSFSLKRCVYQINYWVVGPFHDHMYVSNNEAAEMVELHIT